MPTAACATKNRSLFTTEHGYIGLGSSQILPGDKVTRSASFLGAIYHSSSGKIYPPLLNMGTGSGHLLENLICLDLWIVKD
jgi:hypothetical protein